MYLKKQHFKEIILNQAGVDVDKSQVPWTFTRLSANAAMFSIRSAFNFSLYIVYVNTLVFRLDSGIIRLNNGGWNTVTTKKWINYGLDFVNAGHYLFQEKYKWYIMRSFTHEKSDFNNQMVINIK